MALAELDRIVLTQDLPQSGLAAGDVGIIVHVYHAARAYEVEVFSLTGATVAVATAPADAVRPIASQDVVSTRPLAAE